MDRVDYLQRDAQAAGVPYGNIDVNYLLNSLKISPWGMLGVDQKAVPAAEHYLLARFFMHRTVYYHKATFGMEEACRQLLRRLRDHKLFDIPLNGPAILDIARSPKLAMFTDGFVDTLVNRAAEDGTGVLKVLARSIQRRCPPKLLKEVLMFRGTRDPYHAGKTFWDQARSSLRDLANKYGVPLEQFLLCRTRPLRLEERGHLVTVEEAKRLAPESEDATIKVFVGQDQEPTSLVDIEYSLISLWEGQFFQARRLYYVQDDQPPQSLVTELRKTVQHWDK